MNPRYFPLQKRPVRRLWHPSTIRSGKSPSQCYDIQVDCLGEIHSRCLGTVLDVDLPIKMVPIDAAVACLRTTLPVGSTMQEWSTPEGDGGILRVTIPPQPLHISAKIRKLYES